MSNDIRDALKWLLAVCDTDESNVLHINPDLLLDAIVFARAALAAEPVGEAEEMAEWLRQRCGLMNPRHEGYEIDMMTRAAPLLQQLSAPAPVVVPVACEWDDGFMSGVCAALATVTVHEENVIWREIVRSVGVDNALNYAANVNPEDWDLAGFSEYAQIELGKGKPLPLPQGGEG